MILANGYIRVISKEGGGVDEETRHPLPFTEELGSPIPCQWRASQSSYKGISNNEGFILAKYEILLDRLTLEGVRSFGNSRFQLYDNNSQTLGEYSPLSVEDLPIVQVIKILV